jgi:hypothetical protein
LPEPDWIDQATGEWMDSLNHHECKVWWITLYRSGSKSVPS